MEMGELGRSHTQGHSMICHSSMSLGMRHDGSSATQIQQNASEQRTAHSWWDRAWGTTIVKGQEAVQKKQKTWN